MLLQIVLIQNYCFRVVQILHAKLLETFYLRSSAHIVTKARHVNTYSECYLNICKKQLVTCMLMILYSGIKPSRITTKRVIHLVTHLAAVAISAFYSAALISFLTVQIATVPFTTMEGLIDDDTYKLGVLTGSANHILLKVIALCC